MTPAELRSFAEDIAREFNAGKIRAPVHLDGGNEEQLTGAFKTIDRDDWVCGQWRMMSKCLLHGVPPKKLKASVMAGHSITLCYPERRIVSSAIVGGIMPIALGIAWWLKRTGQKNRVHCFMGDMTALTGAADECKRYARWNNLPIRFITEDNGKSVCTKTAKAWGGDLCGEVIGGIDSAYYRYELAWPHSGVGERVNF